MNHYYLIRYVFEKYLNINTVILITQTSITLIFFLSFGIFFTEIPYIDNLESVMKIRTDVVRYLDVIIRISLQS